MPPEQMNLQFELRQIAVTPPLCAFSIYQRSAELSTRKARIRPSDHPEIITSSVKTAHIGNKTPLELVGAAQRAVTE